MSSFLELTVDSFVERIEECYRSLYSNLKPHYLKVLREAAQRSMAVLGQCDAAYHNADHTMLVTLAGQEILLGKQKLEGNISAEAWLHSIISWLLHDIGYAKGACSRDCPEQNIYALGRGEAAIALSPEATAASLTPYHVERSKQFARENFSNCSPLAIEILERNIELTRFPVPKGELYADTLGYAGLTRAADLIGQLADPQYLSKLPALYREFEETGANLALGCRSADDLHACYPNFFWKVAYPYFKDALPYLKATQLGQQIVANLYANVFLVERELYVAAREYSCAIAKNYRDTAADTASFAAHLESQRLTLAPV
ncbi:metal-dependent phosphohydrolase [Oscillatoria sp. FACHB-1406]|uniref:metal-dependent phosphohydrolase n=1 Tax=Oscillatoria sp. FACHB-1406 TaxID=2692846 RepID=UPI00168849F6|nr:metal-dependent phosphohydrolase [Oscillatoria sp. FACHB-1406]MBD2577345.1 metal-dependent phosphohydrolase [Oscillatoria sp. FACHB-1406]